MIQNYKSKGLKESLFFAYRLICGAAIATFLLATITACSPDKPEKTKKIHPISFTANLGDKASSKTRYTGDVNNGVERIEWLTGDKITMRYYDENNTVFDYSAEYELYPVNGEEHKATLRPVSQDLYWDKSITNSSNQHIFIALYPSTSNCSEDAVGHEPSILSTDRVVAYIPSVQTSFYDANLSTATARVYQPDMKLLYMVARKSVSYTDVNKPLALTFVPMVTAFEFIFTGESEEELIIESIRIESLNAANSRNYAISGEYRTHVLNDSESFGGIKLSYINDSESYGGIRPIPFEVNDSNKHVTTHLNDPEAIVSNTKSVRATLFTFPASITSANINGPTLILTLRGADSSDKITRTLRLDGPIGTNSIPSRYFLGRKKHILNLSLPNFKDVRVSVTDILNPIEVGSDITSTIDVLDYDSEDRDDILI